MTTDVPGVMGVVSWMGFPSALVRVAERRNEADPGRDVRSVGVMSEGMSHGSGSCVVGEERKRGLVDDDDGMVVVGERSFLLTNAFEDGGDGVNADRVLGVVMAVRATRPAVAVANLMIEALFALPL